MDGKQEEYNVKLIADPKELVQGGEVAKKAINSVTEEVKKQSTEADKASQAISRMYRDMAGKTAGAGQAMSTTANEAKRLAEESSRAATEVESITKEAAALAGAGSEAAEGVGRVAASVSQLGLSTTATLGVIGLLAAGIFAVHSAYKQGAEESKAMNEAIRLTGNYSGKTVAELRNLAESLTSNSSHIDQTTRVVTAMAASGKIAQASFYEVADAIAVMHRATGRAIDELAPKLISAFADPDKGAKELNSTMHILTATQVEYIEKLDRMGERGEAQRVFAEAVTGALKGNKAELTLLGEVLEKVKGGWARFWNAAANIGRADTTDDKISSVRAELKAIEGDTGKITERIRAGLQERLRLLTEKRQKEEADASAAANRAAEEERREKALAVIRSKSHSAQREEIADKMRMVSQAGLVEGESLKRTQETLIALAKDYENVGKARAGRSSDNSGATAKAVLRGQVEEEKAIYRDYFATIELLEKQGVIVAEEAIAAKRAGKEAELTNEIIITEKMVALAKRRNDPAEVERLTSREKELRAEIVIAYKKSETELAALDAKRAQRQVAWEAKETQNAAKEVEKLNNRNEALKKEIEQLGLTAEQVAKLNVAREQQAATTAMATAEELDNAAALLETRIAAGDASRDLESMVDTYRKLAEAARESAKAHEEGAKLYADRASKESAIAAQREQIELFREAERIGKQAFVGLMTEGVSSFKAIGASIKTFLIDMLYQMTLKKWFVQIGAVVSGSMSGGSSTAIPNVSGTGGVGGSTGNGFSGVNPLSGVTGGLTGNSTGIAIADTAQWISSGSTMGPAAPGTVGSAFSGAGNVANWQYGLAGIGGSMLGGWISGNQVGSTLGGVGAVGGYALAAGSSWASGASLGAWAGPIGAVIGAVLGGLIGTLFKQSGGTPHQGAVAFGSETGYKTPHTYETIRAQYANPADADQFMESDFTKRYQAQTGEALGSAAQRMAVLFNEMTRSMGGADGYRIALGFSADGESKTRGRMSILDAEGNEVFQFMKRFSKNAEKGFTEFIEAAGNGMVAALKKLDLGEAFNKIFAKATDDTAEAVIQTAAAIAQVLNYADADPITEYAEAMKSASATIWAAWDKNKDPILEMAEAFDGSATAAKTLNEAVASQTQLELQLAQQLSLIGSQVKDMFASTSDYLRYDAADSAGKYAILDQQAGMYRDLLSTAIDPQMIAEYASKLNETIKQEWGLLDENQKDSSLPRFLELVEEANELAQKRREASEKELTESKKDFGTQLRDALMGPADKMDQAATKLKETKLYVKIDVDQPSEVTSEITTYAGEP